MKNEILKTASEDGHFPITSKGVKEAREYLLGIKADMVLNIERLSGWEIVGFANINWQVGARPEDIQEFSYGEETE